MSKSATVALLHAVDTEAPREERARAAAEIVRSARGYRCVGVYDVDDGEFSLIGASGVTAREEAVDTRVTVASRCVAVVPVLGAESAIVIGTLEVESNGPDGFSNDDVEFLEECAAALRPLYD